MTRPAHREPVLLLVVAAGGTVGTAGRAALAEWLPHEAGLPVATLLVNLVGAFLLGLLLESLLRRGPETGRGRLLRLGLGTGVLGGFTTYSALALELQQLLTSGDLLLAVGYGVGSVGAGLVACVLGMATAARITPGGDR